MPDIRPCTAADRPGMLTVINDAAQRYRGILPADLWRDPYMAADTLESETAAGVRFWGALEGDRVVGVMGQQAVGDVLLIRHAYVAPALQGWGTGTRLLNTLCEDATCSVLVGTWAAADWAVRFYQSHRFAVAAPSEIPVLLRRYWSISDRQVETSTVLVRGPLDRSAR